METYLMMLYVTLDQESALKKFFSDQGWNFSKPDLSVTTDKLGPSIGTCNALENDTDLKCTPAAPGIKRKANATQRNTQKIKLANILPTSSDVENSTESVSRKTQEDTDAYERLNEKTGVFDEMTMGQIDVEEVGNMIFKMKKRKGNGSNEIAEENHDADDDNNDDVGDDKNDDTDSVEGINDGDNEEKLDGSNVSNTYPRKSLPLKRMKKYHPYSRTALLSAYELVKETGIGIRTAARRYGVPQSTLRDRVKGRVDPETYKTGPDPLFSLEQEAELVEHVRHMAKLEKGFRITDVINKASQYAVHLGKRTVDKPLSKKWFRGFVERWPELRVIKPRGLSTPRAASTNAVTFDEYFINLCST